MKFKKLFLILIFNFLFSISLAQEVEYPQIPGVPTPTATTTFPEYVRYLFYLFILVSGVIAILVLIWAGFLWFTSTGDPQRINEAKRKAIGSLFGLIILLSSYLIITTINPNLKFFRLAKIESLSGIYLVKGKEKCHIDDSTLEHSKINCETNTFDQIKFISPTSSLLEVYLFEKENFGTPTQKIVNPGAGATSSITLTQVKSIFFFKRKPGFYLYDEINLNLVSFPYPRYISGTMTDLGKWNKKTKSIKIFYPSKNIHWGAVLFEGHFEGKCGIISSAVANFCDEYQINDLDTPVYHFCLRYFNKYGMAREKLTSLILFPIDLTSPTGTFKGEVVFYDQEGCSGNSLTISVTSSWKEGSFIGYFHPEADLSDGLQLEDTWADKIESFEPRGNLEVVLMASSSVGWICQAHWVRDETGCVNKLKGSSVYPEASPNGIREFLIFAK